MEQMNAAMRYVVQNMKMTSAASLRSNVIGVTGTLKVFLPDKRLSPPRY